MVREIIEKLEKIVLFILEMLTGLFTTICVTKKTTNIMTKKELKKFFGHSFGSPKKFERTITNDKFMVYNDRSGNVISISSINPLKQKTIVYRYTEYTENQWLARLNHQFRGQPISLCKDEIFDSLKIFE